MSDILASSLVKNFVKTTNDSSEETVSNVVTGTVASVGDDSVSVQVDGSEGLTVCNSTSEVDVGDKVQVTIEDHSATINGSTTNVAVSSTHVENVEGDVANLEITAEQIQSTVSDVEGNVSTLTQRADSIESKVSDVEGNVSTLTQTATEISSKVEAVADDYVKSSELKQTVEGFDFILTDSDVETIVDESIDEVSLPAAVTLFYASSSTSTPSKPTSSTTIYNSSSKYAAWNKTCPTYSSSYPYLYTCMQYYELDGTTVSGWSTVVSGSYANYVSSTASTANSASSTASSALSTANSAATAASNAAKTATSYINFSSSGLLISQTATASGWNVLIGSSGMDIRSGTTVYATYGSTTTIGRSSYFHMTLASSYMTFGYSTYDPLKVSVSTDSTSYTNYFRIEKSTKSYGVWLQAYNSATNTKVGFGIGESTYRHGVFSDVNGEWMIYMTKYVKGYTYDSTWSSLGYAKPVLLGGTRLVPYNAGSAGDDTTVALGAADYRWNTVYCNNLNNSSDRNMKNTIEYFDEDDKLNEVFDDLRPCTFYRNTGDRRHIGFIAQDVEQALNDHGETIDVNAMVGRDQKTVRVSDERTVDGMYQTELETDDDGNPVYRYSLNYMEFIALNTHQIQKLKKRVAALEETVSELKGETT